MAGAAVPPLPPALEPWRDWVLAEVPAPHSPPRHDAVETRLPVWPGLLNLQLTAEGGTFSLEASVFDEAMVPLPGGAEQWPQAVTVGGEAAAVLDRDGSPSVWLAPGGHRLEGRFRWGALPEHLRIPGSIGVVTLSLDGQVVESPNWDDQGRLWLRRNAAEAADEDQLGVKVYRLLRDGIPLWLTTAVELTVTGKSREVELGHVLPAGWQVSKVECPLPCLVDESGLMKVQVRAGTWTATLTAFRTSSPGEVAFAAGARPLVATELIALQADPSLRVVELSGLASVDASQTTFPQEWRNWPVYQWTTSNGFTVEEKLRGMGLAKPVPPHISRELWLDEDGRTMTFRDTIEGDAQQVWRLDVSEGQELGAVKASGVSQLITRNPRTGRPGVEVRDRALSIEATGRASVGSTIPATGWETGAGGAECQWHLPPGWRLVALFGAEWVDGDWLTAWSLLDVFLLLVFSIAVQRLWGWRAGLVAFGAFVLAYHEPGAPRWTWLVLVCVLAVGRALAGVKHVLARRWPVVVGLAALAVVWMLVPFVTRQVTALLYPQLEQPHLPVRDPGSAVYRSVLMESAAGDFGGRGKSTSGGAPAQQAVLNSNLVYDQSAQIQTGPAVPKWSWRSVRYGWNGPVAAGQSVRPVLLSPGWQRVLIAVRLGLVFALLSLLLKRRGTWTMPPLPRPTPPPLPVTAFLLLGLMLSLGASPSGLGQESADAQEVAVPTENGEATLPGAAEPIGVLPSAAWLDTLRARLLKPSDAFPNPVTIAAATLKVDGRVFEAELEVHAGAEVAVPLPGRLPSWSPVSVRMDEQPTQALQRIDDHLWVVVPSGVHRVYLKGQVPPGREWAWSFPVVPRHLTVEAPGWSVAGLRPDGVPENQIFLTEQQGEGPSTAAYDRRDFTPLVLIERHLELGLVWRVRTVARRLTDPGAAVSLSVPLLATERLLTSSVTAEDGRVEVRLGAAESAVEWQSELTPRESLTLQAQPTDRWVEQWHLEASPVWNVALEGIAPLYQSTEGALVPVWRPWPGESVTLRATQPEAVQGATMTVREASYETQLGGYQRTARLTLDLHASVGRDLGIALPPDAEVTGLSSAGQRLPVRSDGGQVLIPVRPGEQSVVLEWTANRPLTTRASVDALQLPVESANLTTTVAVPAQRWVLWTRGPVRGPAVRFWAVLVCALIFAWGLGSLPLPTLRRWEWALLLVGLTQTFLPAAFCFVLWVFALAARGRYGPRLKSAVGFNFLQIALTAGALLSTIVLISVLHVGLLGDPQMFIRGEGSTPSLLRWFQPRSQNDLPAPVVVSVSIWFYRFLMLAWALWLAFALMRWVKSGWQQFTAGGLWKSRPKAP